MKEINGQASITPRIGSLVTILFLALSLSTPAMAFAEGKGKNNPEAATAKERVAELERLVVELKGALEEKTAELEALRNGPEGAEGDVSAAASAPPKVSYEFDKDDPAFDFLGLGTGQDYIQYENERLLDQLRTSIPPLYEPAFSPFHGYTLPAGAFRLTLANDRFVNDSDFGRDEFYSAFFKDVEVQNQHVSLNAFYGIDRNNTLRVSLPFKSTDISGTGEAFRIQPMVMTMEGNAFGLGDLQVNLKHKWFDQGYKPFNLATVIGVQLPTGDHNERFNDSQTLFLNGQPMPISAEAGGPRVDLFSDDLRLPNSAQPGTGSWGLNLGVMATRQLTWNRSRGAIHGGVMYRAFKNNDEGVRPGNELLFGVSYVRPPLKSDHVSFDITLFGRMKQSERFPGLITHPEADPVTRMPLLNSDGSIKMFTTARPPFEHGTVMFLSPSIILIPKSTFRLTISPMFRIYEPQRGPSPAFRLVFGIQSIF